MIIYEVNLSINNDIYKDYRSWLAEHIQEMLKIPGFINATVMHPKMDLGITWETQTSITIQYLLESNEDLLAYLNNYAPKMRGDGVSRFQGKFTANRRVLEVEEVLNANKYTTHI